MKPSISFAHWIGVHTDRLFVGVFIPLLITIIWFIGPVVQQFLEGEMMLPDFADILQWRALIIVC